MNTGVLVQYGLLDVRIVCVISEVILCQQRVLHLNTPGKDMVTT